MCNTVAPNEWSRAEQERARRRPMSKRDPCVGCVNTGERVGYLERARALLAGEGRRP
jgi:hypothetical protein